VSDLDPKSAAVAGSPGVSKNAGGKADGAAPPPLAATNPAGPAATASPLPAAAKSSVPLFGGWRGGKKRTDGLKPGSPEAAEADRKKERERKKRDRAEASALREPPPLSPLPSSATGETLPPVAPLASVPGIEGGPQVVWVAKDVEALCRELIELTEELCTRTINKKCRLARLPQEVIKEIERDAAWAKRAKDMIEADGSELAALYLNQSAVPIEVRPWIMLSLGSLQVAIGQMKILKRLDQLIALANQPTAQPGTSQPPEKKS
jgi:hypothetical protein